jgi:UDP-N-acetyl-D-mannosaminuronate dehydrogenase
MSCCKGGGDDGAGERVFGAIIKSMDGPDIDEDEVPMLVTETIAYLKSKGLDSSQAQGIFRKSANAVKLREIKAKCVCLPTPLPL